MQAEIVMIGTELLLGQIEDTNATYMGRVLAENGINLFQKTTVGDNKTRIVTALNDALNRSDVILCSGGLGPTEDDLTRECVAEVFDRPLEYHEDIFAAIEAMFARYGLKITENNKRQAMVPKDALIVTNPHGTAPGLLVDDPRGVVVCMPGVPRELKPMLTDKILPWLRDRFNLSELIHYRVLKVCGMGESHVDEAIGDLITGSDNPTVGILANPSAVRIRIAAKAPSRDEADALIDPMDAEIRKRLPNRVMGTDDDTIESVVNDLLGRRRWTLALAETLSGGATARRLTLAGASQFVGGHVYPVAGLDVSDTSREARRLAHDVRDAFHADCGLAIVSDLDAGATVVALNHPDGDEEWTFARAGVTEIMQERMATMALEHLRRLLIDTPVSARKKP